MMEVARKAVSTRQFVGHRFWSTVRRLGHVPSSTRSALRPTSIKFKAGVGLLFDFHSNNS